MVQLEEGWHIFREFSLTQEHFRDRQTRWRSSLAFEEWDSTLSVISDSSLRDTTICWDSFIAEVWKVAEQARDTGKGNIDEICSLANTNECEWIGALTNAQEAGAAYRRVMKPVARGRAVARTRWPPLSTTNYKSRLKNKTYEMNEWMNERCVNRCIRVFTFREVQWNDPLWPDRTFGFAAELKQKLVLHYPLLNSRFILFSNN